MVEVVALVRASALMEKLSRQTAGTRESRNFIVDLLCEMIE